MKSRTAITAAQSGTGVTLGRIVHAPGAAAPLEIVCQDPALRPHATRPWLRAYVARQTGFQVASAPRAVGRRAPAKGDPAQAPDWAQARHTLIAGSSGGGKSMLCECMLCGLLARGHSAVIIDPKFETIARLAARAREAGVPPGRITVVSPRVAFTPGWNPFQAGIPPAQAAADFVALIARSNLSWGVRLGDLLMNACIVAAAHGLSPYEMVQILTREGYVQALLGADPPGPPSAAYAEASDFFRSEFLTWARSARADAVSAVTNKTRELLRNEFLHGLLCARRNTLRLSDLWEGQRVVLVHLDRAALGEEGARLLGGLVASSLFRTALRASGKTPVTLLLDELATAEHFIGETLIDIATTARSYNLRLVAACQHLAALSPPLRSALLGNTAVQAFCRLGPDDARMVAASLAAGTTPRLARLQADVAERSPGTGRPVLATWRHTLRDASGHAVRLSPAAWDRLRWDGLFGGDALASLVGSIPGAGRVYVHAADSGRPEEARRYVAGLSPEEFWLEGPAPLALVVAFPKPRLSGALRATEADAARAWTRALQDMPVQHAAFKVAGQPAVVMRVTDMDAPLAGAGRLLEDAARANGQGAAEVAEAARWRREQVARAVKGMPPGFGLSGQGDGRVDTHAPGRAGGTQALSGKNGVKSGAGVVPRAGGFAHDGSLA